MEDYLTTEEMRHKLIDFGIDVNNDMPMWEIIDLFDAMVNRKQGVYGSETINEMSSFLHKKH